MDSALDRSMRIGMVCYGVVHLLVAWLALQLAWGERSGSPTGRGALHELASQPFGQVLVWVVGLGFLALVVWEVLQAWRGHTDEEGVKRIGDRVASAGKAAVYGALGATAIAVAAGAGGGGSRQEETVTAKLMSMPAGPWLVAGVGLVVAGVGVALVARAASGAFLDELSPGGQVGEVGTAASWLGRAGHAMKGVAFGVVGGLFLWAAVTTDARRAGGLDDALAVLVRQPSGPYLLTVVAVGIACFGLYCFVRARYIRRTPVPTLDGRDHRGG